MTQITIATHNGSFHADDVFSIAALKQVIPEFKLIRTRDEALISKADIVVDVGSEYDPDTGRFDHHQRGGAGERANGIPYSSFGLVWQKYGKQICQHNQILADAVDGNLVTIIDAIDCGNVQGVEQGISLSQTISMYNPTWQEESEFDRCFDTAVVIAEQLLKRFIAEEQAQINAQSIVTEAINQAADPKVIVLNTFAPWKKTLHALSDKALYVVFPSHSGQWMLQTVPVEPGSFEDRQPLPAHWAGLSGDAFQAVTGLDDAMFCHNGLFIAGAESFASIMKMSALAVSQ